MKKWFKTNKTAAVDQIFATILFIVAFAIIVVGFLHFGNLGNPIQQDITALHIKLDDEENFANLMQSYTDYTNSQTMTDLLVESITTNEYSKFDTVMSTKMQRDFSENYWRWVIYTSELGEKLERGRSEIIYEYERPNYSKLPSESWSSAMQIPFIKNSKQYYIAFWIAEGFKEEQNI